MGAQVRGLWRGFGCAHTAARLLLVSARPLVLGAVLLAACASYRAVPPAQTPAADAEVRATLNDAGALRVAPFFGGPLRSVEGRVVAAQPDSLVLAVARFAELGGRSARRDRLAIPLDEVLLVEERHLSGSKTALAVVVSSAAVGGLTAALFRSAGGTDKRDPGGGDRLRVPLFFFPLR